MRLNGVYEDGDSFRHHVDLKRYGINPTAAILAGPDTRIDLAYEYFHDRRTADRGVPADGDEPLQRLHPRPSSAIPTTASPGPTSTSRRVAVEHEFGDGLTLRNRTMFGDYRQILPEHLRQQASTPATGLVSLGAYNNRNDRQNLFSQTDLVWENRLAGIDQTLLFGFEVGREKSRNKRMTGTHRRRQHACRSAIRRSTPT